jgi:hypothetical protein
MGFLVEYLYPGKGIGAMFCTWILLTATIARWDLRRRAWFWMTIIMMVPLQAPFVLYFPWMNRNWLRACVLPAGLLDVAIVLGCLKLVEKVMVRGAVPRTEIGNSQ